MHELLTIHEVAKQLRVDDSTVRRWVLVGLLEAIFLPHRPGSRQHYRIKRSRSTHYFSSNLRNCRCQIKQRQ